MRVWLGPALFSAFVVFNSLAVEGCTSILYPHQVDLREQREADETARIEAEALAKKKKKEKPPEKHYSCKVINWEGRTFYGESNSSEADALADALQRCRPWSKRCTSMGCEEEEKK